MQRVVPATPSSCASLDHAEGRPFQPFYLGADRRYARIRILHDVRRRVMPLSLVFVDGQRLVQPVQPPPKGNRRRRAARVGVSGVCGRSLVAPIVGGEFGEHVHASCPNQVGMLPSIFFVRAGRGLANLRRRGGGRASASGQTVRRRACPLARKHPFWMGDRGGRASRLRFPPAPVPFRLVRPVRVGNFRDGVSRFFPGRCKSVFPDAVNSPQRREFPGRCNRSGRRRRCRFSCGGETARPWLQAPLSPRRRGPA